MDYIPKSIDMPSLLAEEEELVKRLDVIRKVKASLQGDDSVPLGQSDAPQPRRDFSLQVEVETILREADGKALHGTEILARLKKKGMVVRGQSPKNTLFGTLNRKKDTFQNLGENMWVLSDADIPESPKRTGVVKIRKRKKKSDYTRSLEALSSLDRPSRVADIRAHIQANGKDVPSKSIRSYLGRASREGTIETLGGGLYAVLGHGGEEKDKATYPLAK